jgi:23S rRNA A1618 N6-methylase RlmF
MHPRNRYQRPPDFAALAAHHPDTFGKFVRTDARGHASIDWDDGAASRALTAVLLLHDFGLRWDMPAGHLCPPVPNRLNYLHWVEDLLALRAPGAASAAESGETAGSASSSSTGAVAAAAAAVPSADEPLRCLDIGTGASCIFPLLGAALHSEWRWIATDVDAASVAAAAANVSRNKLEARIRCRLVAPHDPLLAAIDSSAASVSSGGSGVGGHGGFAFCVCNPPFFEAGAPRRLAERIGERGAGPCEATRSEAEAEGGEVGFVGRIVQESIDRAAQGAKPRSPPGGVRWFTSMLGCKASLKPLLAQLRAAGVRNVRSGTLQQGRTRRWVLAWSFTEDGIAELERDWGAGSGGAGGNACVLARKKQAQRKNSCSFVVDAGAGGGGTALEEGEVEARVRQVLRHLHEAFTTREAELLPLAPPTVPTSPSVASCSAAAAGAHPPVPCSSVRARVRGRMLPRAVAATAAASGSLAEAEPSFDFGVSWQASDGGTGEGGGGAWSVEVRFESGAHSGRAEFWRLCDVLKRDVMRTGRKWKRKRVGGEPS